MTFTLTPYQATAVRQSSEALRDAQRASRSRGKLTAVGLTAPTGAGKTVIATHLLEDLLFGNDIEDPNTDLTVLWVTDDPALNRQTFDKMIKASSSRITPSHFEFMDSGFDKPRLVPGRIHFVNTQKLGQGATTYQQGRDGREHGFWNAIAATVTASTNGTGPDFLLIIDEAHKGTGDSGGGKAGQKIGHRLIHGTKPGEVNPITNQVHPAAPVVLAITATPEKFDDSMRGAAHATEKVQVPAEDVRESGLLKDKIAVRYSTENQTSDKTLLALAVEALTKYAKRWRTYYDEENAAGRATSLVQPMLVVQMPDSIKPSDVAVLLNTIAAEDPELTGDAIIHAFGEPGSYDVGDGRTIRRVDPEKIQAETKARVVIFKKALTTGWDCPRAEVMISLRVAESPTDIAQLIGRMVRTPLAKRIESDEFLNKVLLYLPKYNKTHVDSVIVALSGDEGTGGGTTVEIQPVDFAKRTVGRHADRLDDAFELLADMPSSARTKKSWRSETDRYVALASLLKEHKLDDGGKPAAQRRIVRAIDSEVDARSEKIEALYRDVLTLDMSSVVYSAREARVVEDDEEEKDHSVSARAGDIVALYKDATRILPDASAAWYWDFLIEEKGVEPHEARARVAALTRNADMAGEFKALIEKTAKDQVEALRKRYEGDASRLSEPVKKLFAAIWSPTAGVIDTAVEVPDTVSAATETIKAGEPPTTEPLPTFDLHLFSDDKGKFPAKLTSWERDVLDKELSVESLVGWYRNPSRSKHGVAVPYEQTDGETGLLYPDFVFIHAPEGENGSLAVDIVDPHNHSQSDTGPKWAGLARWAATHSDKVRRAVAVIKVGTGSQAHLLSLDLTKAGIADRLKDCHTQADIDALFAAEASRF